MEEEMNIQIKSRPIRYCGDYQNRNVRFVRQMARDGIPFGSAENADRIIGILCCAGLLAAVILMFVGAL